MAQIVSTFAEATGVWHIPRNALADLDKLVADELSKLGPLEERAVADYVRAQTASTSIHEVDPEEEIEIREEAALRFGEKLSLQIDLDKQRKILKVKSFEQALREHPTDFEEVTARGFALNFSRGGIEAKMNLRSGSRKIELSVTPDSAAEARSLFYSLRNWIEESARIPPVENLYELLGGLLLVVAFIWGFAILPTVDYQNYYKQEAWKLLSSGGVTAANQPQAIDILLRLNSVYPDPKLETLRTWPAHWHWGLVVLLLLGGLFPAISPNTILGLGRGEQAVKLFRRIRRVFVYSIPLWVIGRIILPNLQKFLGI